jgi:hypothetical protein
VTVSTGLARARRSQAALALDPIPASKAQSDPLEIAELDKHNSNAQGRPGGTGIRSSTGPMPKSLHFCGNETSPCISPTAFTGAPGFPARFVCFPRAPI